MPTPRRRTPVQKRSVAMVEFVLDAAARILESEGLAGYNTNAVAARAGISVGTLYQYFANKDAITEALILRAHVQIAASLERAISATQGMPMDGAIKTMLGPMIEAQTAMPRLNRLLEIEEQRLPKGEALIEVERRIEALNRSFFQRYTLPSLSDEELDIAARDIGHIIRALLDADLVEGGKTNDGVRLCDRLTRTVNGYFAPLRSAA